MITATAPPETKIELDVADSTTATAPTQTRIENLDINDIAPSSGQPREHFDQAKIRALAESLTSGELLQPIGVRRSDNVSGPLWELIWGERRLRAAKLAGWQQIPAKICTVDRADALLLMGDENLARDDWNPIEKARYIVRLGQPTSEGGGGMSTNAIARRFHRSKAWVRDKKRLLELPPEWQQKVIAGELSVHKALALVPYADRPDVLAAVERDMKENPWAWRSVEAIEHNARLIAEKRIVPAHPYKPQKLNTLHSEKAKGNTNRTRQQPPPELDEAAGNAAEHRDDRKLAPADPPLHLAAVDEGDSSNSEPTEAPAAESGDADRDVDQAESIEYLRLLAPYRADRQALEILRTIVDRMIQELDELTD